MRAGVQAWAAAWLIVTGCWRDNPAFLEGEGETETAGESSGGGSSGEASTAQVGPVTTGETSSSGSGETTGSSAASSSSSSMTSSTSSPTTSAGSGPGTTEGDWPVCGANGLGEATMVGRYFAGALPQPCGDVEGRNFLIVGGEGDLVVTVPCAGDPGLGCTQCNYMQQFKFGFSTPEPAGVVDTSPCVYLSAHGTEPDQPGEPCRYQQMALWWDQSNTPAKSPPLVIFGHGTPTVDPAVALVAGVNLSVSPVESAAPCACVDAGDCCPEEAVEYRLNMTADDAIELAPGEHASITLGGLGYEAYNGRSQTTGSCSQTAQLDWWLLR